MSKDFRYIRLEKRHDAFMTYSGGDAINAIIHASELQKDMLAHIESLEKANAFTHKMYEKLLTSLNDGEEAREEGTRLLHEEELSKRVSVIGHACDDDAPSFVESILTESALILHKELHRLDDKSEHLAWRHGGDGELSDGEYDFVGYCHSAIDDCNSVLTLIKELDE